MRHNMTGRTTANCLSPHVRGSEVVRRGFLLSQEMMQLMSKVIRVLIIEDSDDLRNILQKLLQYRASDIEVVASAASGIEGIELAEEYQPDIVLMDINLPGLDGIEVTKTIRQEVPSSQVILMSGQVEPDNLRRSMAAGARHLLVKPIDGDELISTIRTTYESTASAER